MAPLQSRQCTMIHYLFAMSTPTQTKASSSNNNKTNDARTRTKDVAVDENITFEQLLLSKPVLNGLNAAGFFKPSPIQLQAIPKGKFGLDLIAQAKSGTGKTLVYTVVSLEEILQETNKPRVPLVLILTPTREIAIQSKEVIATVGKELIALGQLVCHTFIGGIPLEEDLKHLLQQPNVIIGTPGRIKQLIEEKYLNVNSIKLFIFDEADKLFDLNFIEVIFWIYKRLPDKKQVMTLSATYPADLLKHIQKMMHNPQLILLDSDKPSLEGVKQFYCEVPAELTHPYKVFNWKVNKIIQVLSQIPFHQCIIFCNHQARAEALCQRLNGEGWVNEFISGQKSQQERTSTMENLKRFKLRILVSTDLTARGVDVDKVNLVINLDLPYDGETYLHRVGRTGRFGTLGIAISFVTGVEREFLQKSVSDTYLTPVNPLPENLDDIIKENYHFELTNDDDKSAAEQLSLNSLKLKEQTIRHEEHKRKKLEAKQKYDEEQRDYDSSRANASHADNNSIDYSQYYYQYYNQHNSQPLDYNSHHYNQHYQQYYNSYYPAQATNQTSQYNTSHSEDDYDSDDSDELSSDDAKRVPEFDWNQYYAGLQQFYQVYSQLWAQFMNGYYPNPWGNAWALYSNASTQMYPSTDGDSQQPKKPDK